MPHLRPLLLFLALLLVGPLAQAQLYQQPGTASPSAKDQVQLYVPEDKTIGQISIPDAKLSVLVQPQGREWREFRAHTLRWVIAGLAGAMIAALLVFYLYRGTIRIHAGRSGRAVARFAGLDRFAHWTMAVSFLLLALTGVVVTFGRPLLIPLIGHGAFSSLAENGKAVHNFLSVPFVLGLTLSFLLWIRDNIPGRSDLLWIRTMGGLLSKDTNAQHAEAGRFNAGQKLVFWSVMLGGGAMIVTGYLLMVPFALSGIGGMQLLHAVHATLAGLLIAAIIAHIYIGTIGMEGAFDAMGRGVVDENWAIEHHRRWYEEQRRKGLTGPATPAE